MKRTKIVATISFKISQPEMIKKMVDAGVDVFRMNTAHQSLDEAAKIVEIVRSVSEDVALLIDTKGPEIRTKLISQPIEVKKGDVLYMTGNDELTGYEPLVHVSYAKFPQEIKEGYHIFVDDGDIEFVVVEQLPDLLKIEACNNGFLKDKKSINVPGSSFRLNSLNDKDKAFIDFAIKHDIDFIAHSFVRNKDDVMAIQEILDAHASKIKIIAKIENQEGIDNLDEILDHAYGVMVARGDLAIEISAERIPQVQNYIVKKCIESKKPVIVATQMLQSMLDHPRPTRAEVGDIASAVFMGTDAVMLSGETAYGDFPLESVQTMARIVEANESVGNFDVNRQLVRIDNEVTVALARVAVRLTLILPIKAVVVDTLNGRTARYLSAFRGGKTVYARCYCERVKRQLALSYGVHPYFTEKPESRDEFINDIPKVLIKEGFQPEDYIIIIGGSFGSMKGASFIEVCKIEDIQLKAKKPIKGWL
ncbi:MAG: pyruvate kinase [Culturomica sp.]|jgi:pyruvate kinase|nr:pyruvate kinase [Culturomica sp.]